MLSTFKVKVIGMTRSNWTIADDDNPSAAPNVVDQTKVFYEMQLRPQVKTSTGQTLGRGMAAESLVIGKSELYDKYIQIPTPFFAEVDLQRYTTGSKEVEEVVGFRPLEVHDLDEKRAAAGSK